MKREEAMTLAYDAWRPLPRAYDDRSPAPTLQERIAKHILSAYRKGETDMRERCAELARGSGATPWRVRALPLTDDPEESNEDDQAGP